MCELAAQERGLERTERDWCVNVVPALAGSDIELVERLWSASTDTPDAMWAELRCYAQERNWSASALDRTELANQVAFAKSERTDRSVPPALRSSWADGIAIWTADDGWTIHPAVLACLGEIQTLEHRLWRGQVRLVLPLLDAARVAICERLTAEHGPSWPFAWVEPKTFLEDDEVRVSPLACSWGHLYHLVQNVRQMSEAKRYSRLLAYGRELRNKIAHGHPTAYKEFATFVRERDRHRQLDVELLGDNHLKPFQMNDQPAIAA